MLPLLGTMHPTGFPAYVLAGWLASVVLGPLGEPAFRINLLSAILVAARRRPRGAAGLRRLGVPLAVAVAAALGFALTPIVWRISSAADVHALHVALVALVVLALVRWERPRRGPRSRARTTRRRPGGRTGGSCSPPRSSGSPSRTTASPSC